MEIWKDIVGYEGMYQVSNFGNVRSVEREIEQLDRMGNPCKMVYKGRVLKPSKRKNGYLCATFSKNNLLHRENIHRIVAKTFIPNPDNKPQVNHKDSNKENNRVDNLEWVDNSGNQKHAFKYGGQKSLRGENAPWAKLTDEIVLEIRTRHAKGDISYRQLSIEYGLSREYTRRLVLGLNWNHI